jgi:hypothetical protein
VKRRKQEKRKEHGRDKYVRKKKDNVKGSRSCSCDMMGSIFFRNKYVCYG